MMPDVVVVGGGISGLATAHELMVRGVNVRLVERQVSPGGNAISERFDGFLMEHGPTTYNASVPGAMEHIAALGLMGGARDLGPDVQRRYLRDQGRLTGISTHPAGFMMSNYLSPKGRLSMLLEGVRPRRTSHTEESIHDFASRRFGREFADKVIEPMAAGLFMGDSRKLSINGAFARLAEMEQEHGSVIRAVLKARKGTQPGRHLYSWRDGIATIPATLAKQLGPLVQTGVTVLGIDRNARDFVVRTNRGPIRAGAVVLAVQPHVAAALLETLDPQGATAAGDIVAPPVNVVFLGYRRAQVGHPLDGLGFLSTKDPTRIISGAQFPSTMYSDRAPDGHVAISAYAGGARNPELAGLDEATLVGEVHRELAELLDIKGTPVVQRTRRWTRGLPQYELGHPARAAVLETTANRVPGLFVTGNFLRGISVANCLGGASFTAQRVAETLTGQTPARATGTG